MYSLTPSTDTCQEPTTMDIIMKINVYPQEAHKPGKGLLSINHRGPAIMELYCFPQDQMRVRPAGCGWAADEVLSPSHGPAGRGQPSSRPPGPHALPPAHPLILQLRPPEISRRPRDPGGARGAPRRPGARGTRRLHPLRRGLGARPPLPNLTIT